MDTNVVVVYHSGYGHTASQAKAVFEGVSATPQIKASLVKVEDVAQHWDTLAGADAIIFGCPTYMGSASGPFKTFMDASSKIWLKGGWKNKIAAGFTNSGSQSGDKVITLTQLAVFAMQHGMIWVGLDLMAGNNSSKGSVNDLNRLGGWLGAMAQSNVDQPAELAPPKADLETARYFGKRVAEATIRWKKGNS